MTIVSVDPEKIRPLRHLVLRKGKPFSTTSYNRDNEKETIHLACIENEKIITCATFYPEKMEGVYSRKAYRLRGMATHPNFRRKGLGRGLMQSAFTHLIQHQADLLWCRARLAAVPFYRSLGFQIIGEQYDIEEIGPHYSMYKLLA